LAIRPDNQADLGLESVAAARGGGMQQQRQTTNILYEMNKQTPQRLF
jgi:hypothetical protein